MQIPPHNQERIVRRVSDLLGGVDAFRVAADGELGEINIRRDQNVVVIGRILRAHLFVEHFMTEYLAGANPRLGSLADARTTFAQEVTLLDVENPDIAAMLPGIKRLNSIRNRLAHKLDAQVTEDDARVFIGCERFAALCEATAAEEAQSNESLEILEDFARHTAVAFTYEFTPLSKAIAQAIREVHGGGAT
jgi:hypothetical protein